MLSLQIFSVFFFTNEMNVSLYDSEKFKHMKKFCVLSVNIDEIMKFKHVKKVQKSFCKLLLYKFDESYKINLLSFFCLNQLYTPIFDSKKVFFVFHSL